MGTVYMYLYIYVPPPDLGEKKMPLSDTMHYIKMNTDICLYH